MVESDDGRDREDLKENTRVQVVIPGEGERSRGGSSDTAQGSADSSHTLVGKRRRSCPSMAADAGTLSEYELERIKRVKANQEMLVSLGIETPLSKPRGRPRKKPQIPLRASEKAPESEGVVRHRYE